MHEGGGTQRWVRDEPRPWFELLPPPGYSGGGYARVGELRRILIRYYFQKRMVGCAAGRTSGAVVQGAGERDDDAVAMEQLHKPPEPGPGSAEWGDTRAEYLVRGPNNTTHP